MPASTPEADEVVEAGEGFVEKLEVDLGVAPFGDLGVGAPPAVAEGEPEVVVGFAEGEVAL